MRVYLKPGTLFLVLLTLSIYLWMVLGPLAMLTQMTNGLTPFDLMPGGYDLEYAIELLDRLGNNGRYYYFTRQIPLDMLYPAMMALLLSKAWRALVSHHTALTLLRPVAFAGQVVAWLAAACDYAENVMLALLLTDRLPLIAPVINWASTFTEGKAIATTLTVSALILTLLLTRLNHFLAKR